MQQKSQALPKSMLREAVNYELNQLDKLQNYLVDGSLEISNNLSQGSKNHLLFHEKLPLQQLDPRSNS
ncbi:IS66 family transposase [Youngiibacter fragilis]|uniref:IS66 family transposase n=1 Tax=Youngiibacter fragilis TaxID=1408819 RepID=UPI0034E0E13F